MSLINFILNDNCVYFSLSYGHFIGFRLQNQHYCYKICMHVMLLKIYMYADVEL